MILPPRIFIIMEKFNRSQSVVVVRKNFGVAIGTYQGWIKEVLDQYLAKRQANYLKQRNNL